MYQSKPDGLNGCRGIVNALLISLVLWALLILWWL